MANIPNNIMPHGHIVYQTDSAWDYFRVQALEEQRKRWRRGDWNTYNYNATHHVKQHSITNEFVYTPIPILTKPHNETHYLEINQMEQTAHLRRYPPGPSSDDYLVGSLFLLFVFLLFYFTQEPATTQKKSCRARM